MKAHEFTLILAADPNEEESDRLYSIVDDGTLATIAGVPQIHFHREAPLLEEAIDSALVAVKKAGFDVVRVEIEPEVMQGTQGFQAEHQLHGTTTQQTDVLESRLWVGYIW
ncbi:hypothetical protein C6502_04455 [Candidatus Poribacteria bacterium]|nr:MAG: hypothetical protein C6502_04455 [Candidatus Poribacteria bacterium]